MNEEVEDLKAIIEQAQELYRQGEQLEAIDWLRRNFEDTAPADIQASQLHLNLGLMLVNYQQDHEYPFFEEGYAILKQADLTNAKAAIQSIESLLRGSYPIVKTQQQAAEQWLHDAERPTQAKLVPTFYSDWTLEQKIGCVADHYVQHLSQVHELHANAWDLSALPRVIEGLQACKTADELLEHLRTLIGIETKLVGRGDIAGILTTFRTSAASRFFPESISDSEIECSVQTGFPLSSLTFLSAAVQRQIADPALVIHNTSGDAAVMLKPLASYAYPFDCKEANKYVDARQFVRAIIYSLGAMHGMRFVHNSLFPNNELSNVALQFTDDECEVFKNSNRPLAFFRDFSRAKRINNDQQRLSELDHVIQTLKDAFPRNKFIHIKPHLSFERIVEVEYLKGYSGLPYDIWLHGRGETPTELGR